MFDWIKRFYGEGIAKFDFESESGLTGNIKLEYIGEWDEVNAKKELRYEFFKQQGEQLVSLELTERVER